MTFSLCASRPGGATLRALIVSCLLACVSSKEAGAQSAEPPLSLAQAIELTLKNNPELQQFPYQLRINEAQALQASTRPAPSLQLEAENVFARTSGERLQRPLAESEITLALSQVVELGDKRRRRMEQVRTSAEVLYTQYELTRLEVLAETARRYYDVLRLQQLQLWAVSRITLEREALDTAGNRARAGALSQAEVSRLRLRLARSDALQLGLAGQLALARLQLGAMWGSSEPAPQVAGDMALLPAVPDSQELRQAVAGTPEFLNQATSRRLAAADLRLQQSNNRGDPTIAFGIRHLGAENDEALVFSIDLPLRQHSSNRGNVAAAQARLALQDARQTIVANRLATTLERIRQTMANEHAMATRLQEQLLPLSRQLLEDVRSGYVQGQFDVMQWLDAQTELVALERELIESRHTVHLQLLELEQLTGQPLPGSTMTILPPQAAPEISP